VLESEPHFFNSLVCSLIIFFRGFLPFFHIFMINKHLPPITTPPPSPHPSPLCARPPGSFTHTLCQKLQEPQWTKVLLTLIEEMKHPTNFPERCAARNPSLPYTLP